MTDTNHKPATADEPEFARQCTAHLSDGSGRRCRKRAMVGQRVCSKHGGRSPQAQRSAKVRLAELVEPAIGALARALEAKDTKAIVRAAQVILDRTGFGPTSKVELETRSAEELRLQAVGIVSVVHGTLLDLGIDADDEEVRRVVNANLAAVAAGLERGQHPASLPPARRQLEAVVDGPHAATEAASDDVTDAEVITL